MKFKKLTIIFVSIVSIAFSFIFGLEWWNTNKSIVSTDVFIITLSLFVDKFKARTIQKKLKKTMISFKICEYDL